MRQDVLHEVVLVDLPLVLHGVEAHHTGVQTLCNLALDAVEGAATDEQDVTGVDVYIFLIGMLATALRRHVDHRSLEQFQQSLLHTLTANVAGNGGVVALAGNLVDFIDEDNAALGSLHIVVGHLQQTAQDALHVLAHIAGLGEHRRIDNGERHVEQLRNGTCHQGLARSRRACHDDVRLLDFNIVVAGLLQTLVVIVDRHRKISLGFVLANDILVEIRLDLCRLGYFLHFKLLVRLAFRALEHAR